MNQKKKKKKISKDVIDTQIIGWVLSPKVGKPCAVMAGWTSNVEIFMVKNGHSDV